MIKNKTELLNFYSGCSFCSFTGYLIGSNCPYCNSKEIIEKRNKIKPISKLSFGNIKNKSVS